MTKKKNKRILLISLYILAGIIFGIGVYQYEKYRLDTVPKLDFEYGSDSIYIEKINYKRNALYPKKTGIIFNDTLYDTYISSVSPIHQMENKNNLKFSDILPPFTLTKKENNDTIHIIKDNKKYYLLISEELERRKNQ